MKEASNSQYNIPRGLKGLKHEFTQADGVLCTTTWSRYGATAYLDCNIQPVPRASPDFAKGPLVPTIDPSHQVNLRRTDAPRLLQGLHLKPGARTRNSGRSRMDRHLFR